MRGHFFVLEAFPDSLSSLSGRIKGVNPAYAGVIMVGIVRKAKARKIWKWISLLTPLLAFAIHRMPLGRKQGGKDLAGRRFDGKDIPPPR